MILDNQRQRELLLTMIHDLNVPGKVLDEVYRLKRAIEAAGLPGPAKTEPENGQAH